MKIEASTLYDIEFRESDVSPGRTEVKQEKFIEYTLAQSSKRSP